MRNKNFRYKNYKFNTNKFWIKLKVNLRTKMI